jgi:acetylglutamate kinase
MVVDLGFVGEPARIDTTVFDTIDRCQHDPGHRPHRRWARTARPYSINADTMAGAIAAALGAARLFLLTACAGRARQGAPPADRPDAGRTPTRLAEDGAISGGMIPKLETCVHAVEAGCSGGCSGWARAACHADRDLHRTRRRHADPGLSGPASSSSFHA